MWGGGCEPPSSIRTEPWRSGRGAPRKGAPYADDALVHCRSEAEARSVLEAIRGRLAKCGLELHPPKTRILYCKDDERPGTHEHIAFDFLGYTFQPRRAKNRWGRYVVSF